ncbi:uncharacterized protein [Centruroides vittatus]|uniref:uncharacterized protein n=1 Tax=Centruroides vittatus TaxID=120091 RepID=UPI00351071FB
MEDKDIDILAFQEPYLHDGSVALLGRGNILVSSGHSNQTFTGFLIRNKHLTCQLLTSLSTEHATTISVQINSDTLYITNIYCPPSEGIEKPLDELANILTRLPDGPFLVCGDFNTKSSIWHSPVDEPRGRAVVDFIVANNLSSLNSSSLPTFSNSNGESWIDLCLGNAKAANLTEYCLTLADPTASDHSYIYIALGGTSIQHNVQIINTTNWDAFEKLLKRFWDPTGLNNITTTNDIDHAVQNLQQVIQHAYYDSTTIKTRKNSIPWWNHSLTAKRKETRKAWRHYYRENDPARKSEKKELYNRTLKDYKKLINKSSIKKRDSEIIC